MGARPGVKLRSRPVRTYGAVQRSWSGAQDTTGKRGWWPQVASLDGGITPSVVSVIRFGGRIFLAGDFATVAGEVRLGFAALEADTGILVAGGWEAVFPGGSGFPQVLATDGTYLYAGGDFDTVNDEQGSGLVTEINGLAVNGLVRFDYNGNLDTTWNPSPNANPDIAVMVYNSDRSSLYIAGNGLTALNGIGRIRVAEILVSDGSATAWNPDPDDDVLAIAVDMDRELVYLGGKFLTLDAGGTPRLRVARTDYAGVVDTWAPDADDEVYALLLDGTGAYVGGLFTNIGVTPVGRGGGAFIDDQGEARSWDPLVDISVTRLAKYREFIFVGGNFTSCDAAARNGLALLHDADHWLGGNLDHDDWDPGLDTATVLDAFLLDRTLYVAGNFTSSSVSTNKLLQAISWPIFTDANSIYFSKAGDDANAGTEASPKLTPEGADAAKDDDHRYVVCQDGGTYDLVEPMTLTHAQTWKLPGGMFAEDGFTPTVQIRRGPVPGTYGARRSGRTKFSTGLPATFLYVQKNGDDASGTRGDVSLPYKTHAAAIADALTGDTIQTQDSGTYIEDLVIGNTALIFQAADGQVPLLQNGAGAIHFDVEGTGTLEMYGYVITDIPKTTGSMFYIKRNLTLWDCTISGNNICIQIPSTANLLTASLNGSIFHKVNAQVVLIQIKTATTVVDNCLFEGCAAFCSSAPFADIGYSLPVATNQTPPILVERTEFRDSRGFYSIYGSKGDQVGAVTPGILEVNRVLFTGSAARFCHGIGYVTTESNPLVVTDTTFNRLGGAAIYTPSGDAKITVKRCLADHCGGNGVYPSFWIASNRVAGASDVVFENCVSIRSTGTGFLFQVSGGATSYQGSLTLTRCVVLGAGGDGIDTYCQPANPSDSSQFTNITGCLVKGISSPNNSLRVVGGNPSRATVTYSVLDGLTGGAFTRGTGFFSGDPLFLDVSDGTENVGLSPESPAFNAFQNQSNIGLLAPLLEVTASVARFWIDGFILNGDLNTYDGIQADFGLAAPMESSWNTFDGLGPTGIQLASGSGSRNCFYSTNGTAISAADSGGVVSRNVGARCDGAFLVAGGTGSSFLNNTSYGCQYGEFDLFGALPAVSKNQVFSASAVLDYAGPNELTFSDVERKSTDATISGTRRAPLFRDLSTLDLRLQALKNGNFFDSPAVGLADDGGDAGAYDFYYGPGTVEWTLIEFMANGYVNPYWMPRHVWLSKMSEDVTFGGVTFSDASASGMEFTFEWPESAYMPQAQIDDLQAVFEATDSGGECQLSFDGGTEWIPVIRMLSSGFDWQELKPLTFAWDGAAMRLVRMVFRVQP